MQGVLEGPVSSSEGALGSVPLTVVVAAPFAPPGFRRAGAELYETKRAMASGSNRGRLVELETGHYVHHDAPDAVIVEIRSMLQEVQRSSR